MKKSKTNKVSLEEFLPILGVQDNLILSKKADITYGYHMSLPPNFSIDQKEYIQIHQLWQKVLSVLPFNTVIHKQDWYQATPYCNKNQKTQESENFLKTSYEQNFQTKQFTEHHCYVYFTLCIAQRSATTALKLLTQQDFHQKVLQCVSLINLSTLLHLTPLTELELVGTPQKSGLIEQYLNLLPQDKAPLVDIRVKDHPFRIGDQRVCTFSLSDPKDLPVWVSPFSNTSSFSTEQNKLPLSFVNEIGLEIQGNHIYNQYLFIDEPKAAIKSFEAQRKSMASLAPFSQNNVYNKQWIDQYLEQVYQKNGQSIRAHFNVMCYSADEKEFENLKTKTATALSKLDCKVHYNTVDTPTLYWSAIPGNAASLSHNYTFYSFAAQALCFLNHDTPLKSNKAEFGINLCERRTLTPLVVDLCEAPMQKGIINNRNKFILGPSGSGKSFFTNHMLRQYYHQGAHIVLIDVGNSYQGLCKLIEHQTNNQDGIYITYTHENPICFNPFYVADNHFDIEKLESLKTLILCLWKKDNETITRAEETTLSTAINNYVQYLIQHNQQGSFDSFYQYIQGPYAIELARTNTREKEFDLHNFLHTLAPFYINGEYHYLLNSPQKIELLQKRFIVFEIDAIKGAPV